MNVEWQVKDFTVAHMLNNKKQSTYIVQPKNKKKEKKKTMTENIKKKINKLKKKNNKGKWQLINCYHKVVFDNHCFIWCQKGYVHVQFLVRILWYS